MKKYRKNYVQHFVEYNACFITKKVGVASRFVYSALVCFTTFLAIYTDVDLNDYDRYNIFGSEPKGEIETHIALAAVAIVYSISAICLPIWYKKTKNISEQEELIFWLLWYCILGSIGMWLMGGFAFIYTTSGIITTIITLVVLSTINIGFGFTRKKKIEQLISADAFSRRKDNAAFKRFDLFNRFLWETPCVVASCIVIYPFLKYSTFGVTLLGIYVASLPLLNVDMCILYMLQLKYAREYGLQEYLPTKSRKEVKEEQRKATEK